MSYYNQHNIAGLPLWGVMGDVAPRIFTEYYLPYDVVAYGSQESRANTYPQEIDYAVSRSSIATACVRVLARFIYGTGFQDERVANAVVNGRGQTMNELLWHQANTFARFGGISIFFNLAMSGEYASAESYPYPFIRLAIPENDEFGTGNYTEARVWDNWAGESPRLNANTGEIETIKLFNPNMIDEDIIEAGGIEYCNGQLMYYNPSGVDYATAPVDPAFEQTLLTGNVPEFGNKFIQNGFSLSGILVDRELPADPDVLKAKKRMVKEMGGIRNAGKIGHYFGDLQWLGLGDTKNLDQQYLAIHETAKQDVIEAFSMPPVLLGRTRQGGFPNQDEMRDAYTLYNKQTEPYRHMMTRQFEKFATRFIYEIGSDYSIGAGIFE